MRGFIYPEMNLGPQNERIAAETSKQFKFLPRKSFYKVHAMPRVKKEWNHSREVLGVTQQMLGSQTSTASQPKLLGDTISLKSLKEEVRQAGKAALETGRSAPSRSLLKANTSLKLVDVFNFGAAPSTPSLKPEVSRHSSRASTPIGSTNHEHANLRGAAMKHGASEAEYSWTVEPGSNMQFALAPEFQGSDFDKDFYLMFLASNDVNKLDIDSWRATMSLSKEMFPNTSDLSTHATSFAFGVQQMKFGSNPSPQRRLQAYGKWYIKNRSRWIPDFEEKSGGVVPHDMLSKQQRHRKNTLEQQCKVMQNCVAKQNISYVYRDAIQTCLRKGDQSLGTRVPGFLQHLPMERPELKMERAPELGSRQQMSALGKKKLDRQQSRLRIVADSVKNTARLAGGNSSRSISLASGQPEGAAQGQAS
jgi:hypothetical protein